MRYCFYKTNEVVELSDLQLDYELNLDQLTENIESNISILKMPL